MNPFENLGNAQYISPYAGNNLAEMNTAMQGLQGSYDKSVAEMDDIDMMMAANATTVRQADLPIYEQQIQGYKDQINQIVNSDPKAIVQAHKKIAHIAKQLAGNTDIAHMQRTKALEDKEQEIMLANPDKHYISNAPVDEHGNSIIAPSIDPKTGKHNPFRGNFEEKGDWTGSQMTIMKELRPEKIDQLMTLYSEYLATNEENPQSIGDFYTAQESNLGISKQDLIDYVEKATDLYISEGEINGNQQYNHYIREAWKNPDVTTEDQAKAQARERIQDELTKRGELKAIFNEKSIDYTRFKSESSGSTEDPKFKPTQIQTKVYADKSEFAEDRESVEFQIMKHAYTDPNTKKRVWFDAQNRAMSAATADLADARANGGATKREVPKYSAEEYGGTLAKTLNGGTEFKTVEVSEAELKEEVKQAVVNLYDKINDTPPDLIRLVNHLNKDMALPEKLEGSKWIDEKGNLTKEGENFAEYAGEYMELIAQEAARYKGDDGFTITLDQYTVDAAKEREQELIRLEGDVNWVMVNEDGDIVPSEGPSADGQNLASGRVVGHFGQGTPLVGISGGDYLFTQGDKITYYDNDQKPTTYYASQPTPAGVEAGKVMNTELQSQAYMNEILNVEMRGARNIVPVSLDDPNAPGLVVDKGNNGFTVDGVSSGKALEAYMRMALGAEGKSEAEINNEITQLQKDNPTAFNSNSAESVEMLYRQLAPWYNAGMDEFSLSEDNLGRPVFSISKKKEKEYKKRPEKSKEYVPNPYWKEDDSIFNINPTPATAEEVEPSAITPVQGKGISPDVVQGFGGQVDMSPIAPAAAPAEPEMVDGFYDQEIITTKLRDYNGNPVKLKPIVAEKLQTAQDILGMDLVIADNYIPPKVKADSNEVYKKRARQFEQDGYYINAQGKKVYSEPPFDAGLKSFHIHGQAIDLAQVDSMKNDKVFNALAEAGFKQHPNEWWHWSIGEFND